MSDSYHTLFTDGGSRGNPGSAACAAVLYSGEHVLVDIDAKFLGINTNNFAEYQGLLVGIEMARKNKVTNLVVKMDSELIVKQINGEYRVKSPELLPIFQSVTAELKKFASFQVQHVPRSQNKIADRLVNVVLDTQPQ